MTEAKDPSDRVVMEIIRGDHDRRLSDIMDAATGRVLSDDARVSWWINIDGIDLREEDLTLDESVALEAELGALWANLGPGSAAKNAKAIIVLLYQTRLGLSEDEALERAGKLTRRQWNDGMGTYDADPPLAASS